MMPGSIKEKVRERQRWKTAERREIRNRSDWWESEFKHWALVVFELIKQPAVRQWESKSKAPRTLRRPRRRLLRLIPQHQHQAAALTKNQQRKHPDRKRSQHVESRILRRDVRQFQRAKLGEADWSLATEDCTRRDSTSWCDGSIGREWQSGGWILAVH